MCQSTYPHPWDCAWHATPRPEAIGAKESRAKKYIDSPARCPMLSPSGILAPEHASGGMDGRA